MGLLGVEHLLVRGSPENVVRVPGRCVWWGGGVDGEGCLGKQLCPRLG